MLKVKRPYMRSVPCAVECRADGKSVYALIGDSTSALTDGGKGIIGFGDTLSDALRALADAIEKEVEVTGGMTCSTCHEVREVINKVGPLEIKEPCPNQCSKGYMK